VRPARYEKVGMSRNSPPTIGLGSLHSIAPKPIVGIVIPRARHSAKNRAKSLIIPEKSFLIIAHLCSETAVFAKNPTFRQA
jgi:hypothetical protein